MAPNTAFCCNIDLHVVIVDSFKIPATFVVVVLVFTEIEKSILKFTWNLKGSQIAK